MGNDTKDGYETEVNYWPSVSDLFMSVLLVISIFVFIMVAANIRLFTVNIIEANMDKIKIEMENKFSEQIRQKQLEIEKDGFQQRFRFASELLFAPGQDSFRNKAEGRKLIVDFTDALRKADDELNLFSKIVVEGHTDKDPLARSASMEDNWELSCERATTVVRTMIKDCGISANKLSAIGCGEFDPRKVYFLVRSPVALREADIQARLNHKSNNPDKSGKVTTDSNDAPEYVVGHLVQVELLYAGGDIPGKIEDVFGPDCDYGYPNERNKPTEIDVFTPLPISEIYDKANATNKHLKIKGINQIDIPRTSYGEKIVKIYYGLTIKVKGKYDKSDNNQENYLKNEILNQVKTIDVSKLCVELDQDSGVAKTLNRRIEIVLTYSENEILARSIKTKNGVE